MAMGHTAERVAAKFDVSREAQDEFAAHSHKKASEDWEKNIFKTAVELDQRWVVDHAADRQEYICQSQSCNLFFPSNVSKQELHNVHMRAWKNGMKTLYYLRSEAIKRADVVSDKVLREYIFDYEEDCLACEG